VDVVRGMPDLTSAAQAFFLSSSPAANLLTQNIQHRQRFYTTVSFKFSEDTGTLLENLVLTELNGLAVSAFSGDHD
jgi:hypothetical protein